MEHRAELNGLLGWHEAECAVEVMIKKSERLGFPFEKLWIRPDEFSGDELVGFCILLAGGYIRIGYPTGYFWVDRSLVEKMRQRPIWSQIPDPPEFEEMYCEVRHKYADACEKASAPSNANGR